MNQETANYIMQRMSKYLDNSQMIKLKDTLDESLRQSEEFPDWLHCYTDASSGTWLEKQHHDDLC